jgi:catechol 2,3-dioxygenase-like lactoylglutathione lyase family enzyme
MKLHHIAIQVADLDESRAFYVDVIGLCELRRQEHSIWLDVDGSILMLEKGPNRERGGLHVIAFSVGASEREMWRAKFAQHHVAIESETKFTLYVRDPDGTRVAVSSYPDE